MFSVEKMEQRKKSAPLYMEHTKGSAKRSVMVKTKLEIDKIAKKHKD